MNQNFKFLNSAPSSGNFVIFLTFFDLKTQFFDQNLKIGLLESLWNLVKQLSVKFQKASLIFLGGDRF